MTACPVSPGSLSEPSPLSSPPQPSPDSWHPRYTLQHAIGAGSTAIVHRGYDRVLQREVALKVLHPHLAEGSNAQARLTREARSVAQIRHPNIVEVYDFCQGQPGPDFLVTELMDKGCLRQRLETHRLAHPALAARVGLQVARALSCAHEAGIIHRDIKPGNIMIAGDHTLKLADFGIAHCLDDQHLTVTGQLIGSPAYMAPEIIQGRPFDTKADLFSLGVLMFELATGTLPFQATHPHALLAQIVAGRPREANTLNPRIDARFAKLLDRCLSREPALRPSAQDLAVELRDYLTWLGLNDGHQALDDYLEQGERSLQALDATIDAARLQHAQSHLQAKEHPQAFELLSVILQSQDPRPEANKLLDRMHQQRSTRRILWAGMALACLGGLGWTLHSRIPPSPERVAKISDANKPLPAHWPTMFHIPDTPGNRDLAALGPDNPKHPLQASLASTCAVAIQGLPVPMRSHYQLVSPQVPKGRPIPQDPHTRVSLPALASTWTLRAKPGQPASAFAGTLRVDPSQCAKQATPLTLRAQARPPRFEFESLNVDLDTLVVQCVHPCRGASGRKQLAKAFQGVELAPGKLEQAVTLRFWAPGYHKKEQRYRVRPGVNRITLQLRPLAR